MLVVLNPEGYFLAQLHAPSEADLARPEVVEAPDMDGLTNGWRLVDGQWVAPPPPLAGVADGFGAYFPPGDA